MGSQFPLYFIPKVFYQVEVRTMQANEVLPHQSRSPMSSWTLLSALVLNHVGTRRGHPQIPAMLGA